MGSDEFYPEERPVHPVTVDGFWMDEHPVTVAEFRRFVEATGLRHRGRAAARPGRLPGRRPGAARARLARVPATTGPVDLDDFRNWWAYCRGRAGGSPRARTSTRRAATAHPVTQVAYEDAEAYAAWAGKALPTEAEWEFAARGGLDGRRFTWGDEFAPEGRMMANTWQGEFPWQNLLPDGYDGHVAVGTFPPNGYGLYDMAGNVWEWTSDFFTPRHAGAATPAARPTTRGSGRGRFHVSQPGRPPAAGDQGRLPPVRPELLPALPPGGPPGRGRDVDGHIGFRCIVRGAAAG